MEEEILSQLKEKDTKTKLDDFLDSEEFLSKYLQNPSIKALNLTRNEIKVNFLKIISQVDDEEKCNNSGDKCCFASQMHNVLYRDENGKINEKMIKCKKNKSLDWVVDDFPKYQKGSIKMRKSMIVSGSEVEKKWEQMLQQYQKKEIKNLIIAGAASIFFELWIYYSLTLVESFKTARINISTIYNRDFLDKANDKKYLNNLQEELKNTDVLFISFSFFEFDDTSFIQEFLLPIIRERNILKKPIIYFFLEKPSEILEFLKKKYYSHRSVFASLFDWIEKK